MGRWLSKEERRRLRKRIRKLKDEDKLSFAEIARRIGLHYLRVLRLYYSREK